MIRTALAPLSIDVTISMVAVITVLAVMVVGLATVARPTRATIAWGAAYAIGILGAYLWLGGYQLDDPVLRAGASAVLFSFEPLIWWGLRAYAGRRSVTWPVVAFIVIGPALLLFTAGTSAYPIAFRVFFLAASVFAAMIVVELFRLRDIRRDITMPLILASTVFVLLAVVAAVSALIADGLTAEQQLGILRGTNSTGAIVMSTCAAFTLILLVRADGAGEPRTDDPLRRRLHRAQLHGDDAWSVLAVHLDDSDDLRSAYNPGAHAEIIGRFHADVEGSLPAAADMQCVDENRTVVLIGGGEESTRHHIESMLGRIGELGDSTTEGARVSASIGWARVSEFGHDYDGLLVAAQQAAAEARAAGGGRWARATRSSPAAGSGIAPASATNLEA